jgi:hypothetical protein
MTGLAAALRETEPGIKIRLLLQDGREVAGAFHGVNGETVDLGNGDQRIELRDVKRVNLEFSSAPKRKPRRKLAQR